MGWDFGKGLGKQNDGRKRPLVVYPKRNKKCLGNSFNNSTKFQVDNNANGWG